MQRKHLGVRREVAAALLFLLVALALYRTSLSGHFLNWDDMAYVTENGELRLPVLPALGRILTTPLASNYNPLQRAAYLLLLKLFGPEPLAFRLASLLLHAACATLVFLVLGLWLGRALPAFAAALLFLVHPANVPDVAWISELKTLLATALALAATWAWLRRRPRPSLGLFALALLAKSSVVVLPALLLLLDRAARRRTRLSAYAPFAALSVLGAGAQLLAAAGGGAIRELHGGSLPAHLATALALLPRYAKGLLWPAGHAPVQVFPPVESWGDGRFLLGAGLAILLALATVLSARRRRRFLVALPFAGLVLLPTALVPIPILYADRYLYLAMPFLLGALADGALRRRGIRRAIGGGALAAALAAAALSASRYQAAWRSSLSLWERSVAVEPASPLAWSMLAKVRAARFDLPGAAAAFRRAAEAEPGNPTAWEHLALAEAARGNREEAERIMAGVIAAHPGDPVHRVNLAVIRERGGDLPGAVRACREGLAACPGSPALEAELARLLAELERR